MQKRNRGGGGFKVVITAFIFMILETTELNWFDIVWQHASGFTSCLELKTILEIIIYTAEWKLQLLWLYLPQRKHKKVDGYNNHFWSGQKKIPFWLVVTKLWSNEDCYQWRMMSNEEWKVLSSLSWHLKCYCAAKHYWQYTIHLECQNNSFNHNTLNIIQQNCCWIHECCRF